MANRGLGSFAQGMVNGFITGKKMQQQSELHELQLAKLRDERALAEGLKELQKDVTPSEAFVLSGPDGQRQLFTDEKTAQEAAKANEGLQLSKAFVVGGKQFETSEQAQEAARRENAEPVKMKKRMELAMTYNNPLLAGQFGQAYNTMRDTNEKFMFDQINQFEQAGNVEGLLRLRDSQAGGNGKSQLVTLPDGRLQIMRVEGDKQVPLGQPVESAQALFTQAKKMVAENSGNFLDTLHRDRVFSLQQDEFAHRKDVDGKQLAISAGNLGVAQGRLGLAAKEFDFNKDWKENPPPTIKYGVDGERQTVPIYEQPRRNPDGSWSTTVEAKPALTGVYPSAYKADPFANFNMGAATGSTGLLDGLTQEQIYQLGQTLNQANSSRGKPASGVGMRPVDPGAKGVITYPPNDPRAANPALQGR